MAVASVKISPQNRNDPEHLTQILDAAVTDFVQDLRDNAVKHSLSAGALASLALYRYILASTKEKRRGPMLLGPIIRLHSNARDHRGKTYLPQGMCGEDAELGANRMPATGSDCRTVPNSLSMTCIFLYHPHQ